MSDIGVSSDNEVMIKAGEEVCEAFFVHGGKVPDYLIEKLRTSAKTLRRKASIQSDYERLEQSHKRLVEALKKAKTCNLDSSVRNLINSSLEQAKEFL